LKGLWLWEVEREKGEGGDVEDKVWGDLSDKSSQVAAMQKESKYQFPDDALFPLSAFLFIRGVSLCGYGKEGLGIFTVASCAFRRR
jgi:hypothetical protein